MASQAKTRTRLTKEDRRAQLLDAAETLLIERGTPALTMERLAEYASVSKALPYSHFDNSDQVLVAVYERVVYALGERLLASLQRAESEPRERIRAMVSTYFDTVAEFGPILSVVTAPGSRAAELADGKKRLGPTFLTDVLTREFDVAVKRARAMAPMLLGALTGAVQGWAAGDASRKLAEELSIELVEAVVLD